MSSDMTFDPFRPPTPKAEWEAYRSREVVWIKPKTGNNGEKQVRTKEGQVMPEEVFLRKYEKLDKPPA